MRLVFTLLLSGAAVAAGTALASALTPGPAWPARVSAAMTGGDALEPFRAPASSHGFVLEVSEGSGVGAAAPILVTSDGTSTVIRYPDGGEWRQTPAETTQVLPASGYVERVRIGPGLPRWLLAGLYPSVRSSLQEIVESRAGVAGMGPYVDWHDVEAAVAAGMASWLPPTTICGHPATGINIPRRNIYPGLGGGDYRVWFDRARRLRLQREEAVDGQVVHGLWCRRYVRDDDVDLPLTSRAVVHPVLPETTVNVTAVALDQAGTVPAGLSPARAYRVVRSWSGAPPERMLPAGVITVFVVEDVGQEPGYVMSVPGSGGAPLRMEWLHEAGRFAFGRDASMPLTAPTLVGSWSNESGIQGGVWLAGNRQWVFVGPGATLGRLATAMRLD